MGWPGKEGGMPLYNRLKEHRARLGVNQAELGKLAAICGTTVEDIFTYEDE